MAVSLRASEQGQKLVDQSRRSKGWTKTQTDWYRAAETSQATLKRFLHGSSINRDAFIKICEALELDWREIADTEREREKQSALYKVFGSWLSPEGAELGIQTLIYQAFQRYVESYTQRYAALKVLGMTEPVWIEDIYTGVQFLGDDGIRQYLSLENLEQTYRETQQRRFQSRKCVKQDGLEVANEQQYLMVLGQPGAGKTTFLQRIGLEALKRDDSGFRHNCIPVFLELKRFYTGTVDIEQAVVRELDNCGFPDAAQSTTKLLQDGRLLVLLDGLDEVPTQQMDQVITQIQDFCDRYNQNRFIVSCRTAAYRSHFRQFCDVVMADFDKEQIQQFITNWFHSRDDQELGTAQRCWELLQKPEYASMRELAQTPLLLTFLCLVFDDAQTFPKQRAMLYKDALDVLLKRWAAEKRIQRDPIYQDLTLQLEAMMLAEIAYIGFVNNRLFFLEREAVEQIRNFMTSNLNAPKHLDAESILEAIQIQQGILVARAKGILSFSHLALQEYLVAQHIAGNNLIEQLVTEHFTDQRWREIFLLVAGLQGNADDLLLRMEAEAQKYTSKKENRSVENYLYANELIVRCKEAAVRVSPQVWTGIEERMLTVKDEVDQLN